MNKDIIYEIVQYLNFRDRYNYLVTEKYLFQIWMNYEHSEIIELSENEPDKIIKITYNNKYNKYFKFKVKCQNFKINQFEKFNCIYHLDISNSNIKKHYLTDVFYKNNKVKIINITSTLIEKEDIIDIQQIIKKYYSGLMSLVAYGQMNRYLTSPPQITYFSSQYRPRYTNFAMDY